MHPIQRTPYSSSDAAAAAAASSQSEARVAQTALSSMALNTSGVITSPLSAASSSQQMPIRISSSALPAISPFQPQTPSFCVNEVDVAEFFSIVGKSLSAVDEAVKRQSFCVAGRSGAGKTTFVNYLEGCTYKTGRTLTQKSGSEVGQRGNGRLGSCTAFLSTHHKPEIFKHAVTDLPGFLENRLNFKMPIDIAFHRLFNNKNSISGIVVVIHALDFEDEKCLALLKVADQLGPILSNTDAVKDSIFFIITHTEKAPRDSEDIYNDVELFLKEKVEVLRENAHTSKGVAKADRLTALLSFMKRNNVLFSNIQDESIRNALEKKLETCKPIPAGAIQYHLSGCDHADIQNFIDECLRKNMLITQTEGALKSRISFYEELLNNIESEIERLKETKKETERKQFVMPGYSDKTAEGLCESIRNEIRDIDANIAVLRTAMSDLLSKATSGSGMKNRLSILQKELQNLTDRLEVYDKADEVDLIKPWVFHEKRFPFFGRFSWSSEEFNYRGRPYTKIEPKYPDKPKHHHQLTSLVVKPKEGTYKAQYETKLGVDGECEIRVKGEKREAHYQDIKLLKQQIDLKKTEIKPIEDEIDSLNREIASKAAEITKFIERRAQRQNRIQEILTSDKEGFEKLREQAERAFEESKRKDLKQLSEDIEAKQSKCDLIEKNLSKLKSQQREVLAQKEFERVLHDRNNTKFLLSICEQLKISTETVKQFKLFDPSSFDIARDFECPVTSELMRFPYQHVACKNSFEKSVILEILTQGEPECPLCKRSIKASDFVDDHDLIRRINEVSQQLERELTTSAAAAAAQL